MTATSWCLMIWKLLRQIDLFNTSTAINMFVKAADPFYTAANMEYVQKSVDELRAGKETAHELIAVADE